MKTETNLNWYLIQNKPNLHFSAKQNLQDQNFKVFLPLLEATKRKFSKFVNEKTPLFPGYMFVRFNHDLDQWAKINNTKGVTRLVCFNGKPKPIPDEMINNIKMRCDDSEIFSTSSELNKGDRVKFIKGPFSNFLAKVETCDDFKRVWVLLEFMGQASLTKVEKNHLQIIAK